MSVACTLIVTAIPNPEHMEDMQAYLQKAGPLLGSLGGSPPNRMKVREVINGAGSAIVLIMEFPDQEKLSAAFASEAYQALIPTRDRGFKSIDICIAGPM